MIIYDNWGLCLLKQIPMGPKKEEIIDDEFIRRPDGRIIEVKKDEVITGNKYPRPNIGFGNQGSKYPSQQGFNSGYPSQSFNSGYRTQGFNPRYSSQGSFNYGK